MTTPQSPPGQESWQPEDQPEAYSPPQPGYSQQAAYPPQPGYPPPPGYPPQAYPPQPGYPQQPGYPGQPGYPQQAYYPPPPRKKKRNTGLIVVVVVLAVVVICGGLAVIGAALSSSGTGTTGTGGVGGQGGQDNAASTIGMNQPGRDGKFEFTVTKVECGIAQVGSDFLNKKAQGQFCLVRVTVKNIGNEARTFSSGSQYAYNAAGQKYDADTAAAIYLEEDSRSFLEDINPGNSVNGTLVFDIPTDATIARVELHDSSFSGGITVNVS